MSDDGFGAGDIKVSVIIPVYNSATYLRECIDSIISQTVKACEFIFVNDGSTDDSRGIIEEYQKADSRIRLINQENQGVSGARNNGIAIAKGEFLSFVDADDTIKADLLETLYKIGVDSNSDIIVSNFIKEQDGAVIVSKSPFETGVVFDQSQIRSRVFEYMLRFDGLNSVANKMYRRELISNNQITFPRGQKLGEDAIFNLKAMARAKGVIFTDYAGYYYREVIGSATRNIIEKDYFKTALDVYNFDYSSIIPIEIDESKIREAKGLRLIDKVTQYGAIYHKPNSQLPENQRKKYVSDMILHPTVQKTIVSLWPQLTANKGVFHKIVLYCIRFQLTTLLWQAYSYSYHRNKK